MAATDAPLICFLNNDTEVITSDWLDRMAGEALRPEVGAVGARLLYADGTVQHAGVVLGLGGVAGHGEAGLLATAPGHLCRAVATHRRGAVTAACLMIRREVFVAAGGSDDVHLAIDFNDVDLCLRLADSGLINVMLPSVELVHKEWSRAAPSARLTTPPASPAKSHICAPPGADTWTPIQVTIRIYLSR